MKQNYEFTIVLLQIPVIMQELWQIWFLKVALIPYNKNTNKLKD